MYSWTKNLLNFYIKTFNKDLRMFTVELPFGISSKLPSNGHRCTHTLLHIMACMNWSKGRWKKVSTGTGSCKENHTYNANYFPDSDNQFQNLVMKISIFHLVSTVTQRHWLWQIHPIKPMLFSPFLCLSFCTCLILLSETTKSFAFCLYFGSFYFSVDWEDNEFMFTMEW